MWSLSTEAFRVRNDNSQCLTSEKPYDLLLTSGIFFMVSSELLLEYQEVQCGGQHGGGHGEVSNRQG